ncbi:MAG: Permease [Candidatus Woesebacteria bacterium GW2011_GWA1_39_21]|uniref:Permease n=1 Tax=Candidatus Woesebacteria bacterium GW2011_GWA1_39_21 TaxID=1618550 RepID=A0A0G0N540_9BACT|nr:MAG: Permease [Candidatus Woesebacteria bacterium GW2011_GWA1_39_21]
MNNQFLTTVVNYALSIFPWLIIGTIVAFFLEKKINKNTITQYFGGMSLKRLALVQILGMISPLSIMSFLPIAHELTQMGFNPGVLLSFFIAERAWDLQSFFIISGLFGLKYAVLNGIAIFTSLTVTGIFLRKEFVHFKVNETQTQNGFWKRQGRLLFLVCVGVVLGALLRTFIPEREFQHYAGNPLQSFLISIVLGFLLYFGPIVGNYPVAKALSDLGMTHMGTFAFLTVSPILNLIVITLFGASVGYKKTLKAFFIYSISATFMTILFSLPL